jgi:hypothetical protein
MERAAERGIARLALRQPQVREALLRREQPQSVIELCEAYDLACEALAYWGRSKASRSTSVAEDYRDLVGEIEQDILFLLESQSARFERPSQLTTALRNPEGV